LCLWHVKQSWQKQTYIKIKDGELQSTMLKHMGNIMYDMEGPPYSVAKPWATIQLITLSLSLPQAQTLWDYIEDQWLFKAHMWVVVYQNIFYACQDHNATIESYYGTLKFVLKSKKNRMVVMQVNWMIHGLTGDVLTHNWHKNLRKQHGFIMNKKNQSIVVGALLTARITPLQMLYCM
jgi:hypothetical protein